MMKNQNTASAKRKRFITNTIVHVILAVLAVANILDIGSWTYVKALVALILSLLMQYAGLHMGLVTLTAPFVLSVWLVALYQTFIVKTKQD